MTTKRFIQLDSGCDFLVKDILRNETLYDGKVVDLLNEQHRSIDQLINDEKYWEKKAKQQIHKLSEENEMLKSFIKSLASPDGKIWLSRGYVYRIDKILNDFNNTENDDGDVG